MKISTSMPVIFIPLEKLTHQGFATPEAALQTYMNAAVFGSFEQLLTACVPHTSRDSSRTEFEQHRPRAPRFIGMQLLAKKLVSDDKVDIQTLVFLEGEAPSVSIAHVVKIGAEWKYSDSHSAYPTWVQEGKVQLCTSE